MNRAIKGILIIFAVLLTVIVAVLLIIPAFFDINDYKPRIQEELTEITGRKVILGGDLDLSLFPWAGVSVSNLTLENPPGFDEEKFVSIKSFEARVKLLPLLSKDIRIKRFVVKEPHIILVKNSQGKVNWEISGKSSEPDQQKSTKNKENGGFIPADLTVNEFAITDGSVIYIDEEAGNRTKVEDIDFIIQKIFLDKPVSFEFDAMALGIPISLDGSIGPLGKEIGEKDIPLDLNLIISRQIEANISGKLESPVKKPGVNLKLHLKPFSIRKLFDALDIGGMIETSDPSALTNVSMKASITGNSEKLTVTKALLELDDSKVEFSATAKEFTKPVASFDIYLDHVDFDRYLPAAKQSPFGTVSEGGSKSSAAQKPFDYSKLRQLTVKGDIRADKIKIKNAVLENMLVKLTGKNGQFKIDSLSMNLYQGELKVIGSLDLKQEKPRSQMEINGNNIEVGPLMSDFAQNDFIEGSAQIDASLTTKGDNIDSVLKHLNGNCVFLFEDGAIKGLNLYDMVQTIKAVYLKFKGSKSLPDGDFGGRTDFSRIHAPFEIKNGLAATTNTMLTAPALRLKATGNADLVNQTLDFKIEPKFVATVQGQGDKEDRSGVKVPVLVQGSFSSPVFRPDMKSIVKEGLNLLPEIQKKFQEEGKTENNKTDEEDKTDEKPLDQIKNLLKSFPK